MASVFRVVGSEWFGRAMAPNIIKDVFAVNDVFDVDMRPYALTLMFVKSERETRMRTIDTEHNWFWQQGYYDALNGLGPITPDETRHSFQRSDYFAGYDAGNEDRTERVDMAVNEEPPGDV